MAPIKLENNIREKLEAREIKPSAEAWKKLEAKLDSAQPKRKSYVFYYAAASFVGLLILASVIFSRNTAEMNNQIVEEKIRQNQPDEDTEIIPNKRNSKEIVSEEKNTEKINAEEKQQPVKKEIIQTSGKKSAVDKKIEKMEGIANISNEEMKKPVVKEHLIISEEEKRINNKVEEVVASVKKIKESNTEVTAGEVEKLLNKARRDLQTQRILNTPKVDATALLQDVEWELDKSFRDKVFDALGEGFQKVRTAVSERNE
jgi:hypothetical protein